MSYETGHFSIRIWRTSRLNFTPEKYYGGIYDLAYELTGSCNRSELNLYIATQMKDFKEFKTYEVTVNGDEAESDVTATPISRPEQPKQQPPKPKRKMRF